MHCKAPRCGKGKAFRSQCRECFFHMTDGKCGHCRQPSDGNWDLTEADLLFQAGMTWMYMIKELELLLFSCRNGYYFYPYKATCMIKVIQHR